MSVGITELEGDAMKIEGRFIEGVAICICAGLMLTGELLVLDYCNTEKKTENEVMAETKIETIEEVTVTETEETTVEESQETDELDAKWTVDLAEIYKPCGKTVNIEILEYLQSALNENDIGWWMPYGVAQIMAESSFNPNAENPNGLDKGLLQYRVTYWDDNYSIFDWKRQIDLYAQQTARRIKCGCSIWEAISRHKTSDYGTYDSDYVEYVLQFVGEE